MGFLSWMFVILGTCVVLGMSIYVRRYIRDVVDYLAAGRLAGRYLLTVGGMESALGLMALISYAEIKYKVGLSMEFWTVLSLPITTFISLLGFCIYRYRETRALSLGEFLEKRYNRSFRIFSMIMRSFAEMLTNTIGPAISARVFMYLFDWPTKINFLGMQLDVFMLVMAVTLIFSLIIIFAGGRVALIVTDCLQGLMCLPIFVIFVGYLLSHFSWSEQIVPVMLHRASGESFINPFDIAKLRDFNLFAFGVTIVALLMNRGIWYGGGSTGSARTPHEQKMSNILGCLQTGFTTILTLAIALCIITLLNHPDFSKEETPYGPHISKVVRTDLIRCVAEDILKTPEERTEVLASIKKIVPEFEFEKGKPFTRDVNPDTPYLDEIHKVLQKQHGEADGNAKFQEFRSLYSQMMLPVTMRNILPEWMMAVLTLLLILLMISTDDSKMFSSSSTIAQDIVLPLYGKPMSSAAQLKLIRALTLLVSVFFFFGSLYLSQLDHVQLYIKIMTSIWAGGAGPVVLFGLYTRFGHTWGAYASLFVGSGTTLFGIAVQRNWADVVYPFFQRHNMVETVGNLLEKCSAPFNPYIIWKMDAVKCPINSYEIFFLSMILSTGCYFLFSWLGNRATCKRDENGKLILFNLDHLLHRDDPEEIAKKEMQKTKKISLINRLVGITPDHTKADRIVSWAAFGYDVIWRFVIAFAVVAIWNCISPWQSEVWSIYFFITFFGVPGVMGLITSVWYTIGSYKDFRRLFHDLALRKADASDSGFVEKKQ